MEKQHFPLIIIGNGIAGITAAITFRRYSNEDVLVLSDEHPYFFSRTALMYVYMGHMKWEHLEPYAPSFWEEQNITLGQEKVTALEAKDKTIECASGKLYHYEKLLIATGSQVRKIDWPGATAKGIQGLYHKKDLERLEELTPSIQTAVVVGGGLIGVELAEMLHSRGIHVIFLIREKYFWDQVLSKEEAQCVTQHLIDSGIEVHCNTTVQAFKADHQNRVTAVQTNEGQTFNCQFAGITIGVEPNSTPFKNSGLQVRSGILVDSYLKTNLPEVYAAGDCAELQNPPEGRQAIEAVWYSGRSMGAAVGATIAGHPTPYTPGIWFNSAKFFAIEYQTYGNIKNNADATTTHWFWKHPKKNCSFRIAFNTKEKHLLGVSSLGLRLRQEVCTQWIQNKTSITEVMECLSNAHFDPEFTTPHLKTIQAAFFEQHHELKTATL